MRSACTMGELQQEALGLVRVRETAGFLVVSMNRDKETG